MVLNWAQGLKKKSHEVSARKNNNRLRYNKKCRGGADSAPPGSFRVNTHWMNCNSNVTCIWPRPHFSSKIICWMSNKGLDNTLSHCQLHLRDVTLKWRITRITVVSKYGFVTQYGFVALRVFKNCLLRYINIKDDQL